MMSRLVLFLLLTVPVFAGPRIKVVAYNIHFGGGVDAPALPKVKIWNPFGDDPVVGGPLPLSRGTGEVDAIADALKRLDPDVVILNEVLGSCAQSMFIDQGERIAERTGWHRAFFASSRNGPFGKIQTGGNMILTRHEIKSAGGTKLATGDDRAVTTARVMLPGLPGGVFVGGTHLSTSPAGGMRARQVDDLATAMLSKQGPILIGGDFNEQPGGADVRRLHDRFDAAGRPLQSAYDAAPQGPGESFPAKAPRARIDYLFATKPFVPRACYVARDVMHSDHLPVVAEYEITQEAPLADEDAPLALLGVAAR